MRVIALGTSAAYPGPHNACSGWLVQERETNLLIDCGSGVLANLQAFLSLTEVTAVVISHMHADHFFDLVPLRYAYKYALKSTTSPSIYLPPKGDRIFQRVIAPLSQKRERVDFLSSVFSVQEYDPSASLRIGALTLRFALGNHYIPCWAIAVEADRRVVFTGDTGPSEKIAEFAWHADLLVSEATYLNAAEEEESSGRGHLTAREAGELARRADAKKVLLTHLWPNRDRQTTLAQAREVFPGDIALAEQGRVYEV